MGKCPGCATSITSVNLEPISVRGGPLTWEAVAYLCPECHTIISMGIDPVALKTKTVNEILEMLCQWEG